MFVSTHYAGTNASINFEEGETYKKVFGPVFVYLNSASSKENIDYLWFDAVQQVHTTTYYYKVFNTAHFNCTTL